jgi:hypothetical protein
MPQYRVDINGQNFLVLADGRAGKYGFFTTRFVEAPDSAAAEEEAVRVIRETRRLRELVRNAPDDPPLLDVTAVTELDYYDDRVLGLAWYPEG